MEDEETDIMDRDITGVPAVRPEDRLSDSRVRELTNPRKAGPTVVGLALEVMAARGLCADPYPVDAIHPGDTVRHWKDDWQAVVDRIENGYSSQTSTELLAFFVGGGFWRVSQLRRVR